VLIDGGKLIKGIFVDLLGQLMSELFAAQVVL